MQLLDEERHSGRVTKIVITGGPCAGKTTAMSWIQNAFTKKGYLVLFVDETATQLINGGAKPWLSASNRDFQWRLIELQLAKERAFLEIGRIMKEEKILIVCDRAVMDNCAYMTPEEFRWVQERLQRSTVSLRDEYDAVFHLVTAAKGAEKFYTLANNQARTETVEEARTLDDRLIAAWTGHPHLRVIDNTTDFDEKMRRLIREISAFLGEPTPYEIERKYLIRYPDIGALLAKPTCQRVDIVQTYLKSDSGADEVRIRQRGADGNFVYFKTRKKKLSGMKRVEEEERLTQDEYVALMLQADPKYRPIRKQRFCLSENGLYYEIDVYPEWQDKAIMEVELSREDQQVTMPAGIEVIREVTGDEQYSNLSLARIQ